MTTRASSCALHNAPACEPGPCDCGATDILERINEAAKVAPRETEALLAECAITIKAYRASAKSLVSEELAERVEFAINQRHGGDCTIIEAMKIALELSGFDQARGKE